MKKSLYILIIIFWTTKLFAGPKPSLFDIKINDNVEDYSLLEKGQEIFDYSNFLKKDLINYAWMEVEAGFFKMTENENFVNYAVYLEKQDTINKLASNALGEKIMNVNIVGVDNSINRYNALVKDAIIALDKISFNCKSHNYLKDLAEYIIKREK